MTIENKELTDIGVLVGRFQVPELHLAHRESGYRFVGGFVRRDDNNLESAARRELLEEAHIELSGLRYLCSYLVDDWRYRSETDKIMTMLFVGEYKLGTIQPDDDIEELRWFACNRDFDISQVEPVHKPLIQAVLDWAGQNNCGQKEKTSHELLVENR